MKLGRYEGLPTVRWLEDGRRVQLSEPFCYIQSNGTEWRVPEEAIVDGASIPQVLWTVMKGPFEGLYRNASIIHDWHCDLRTRPWKSVHRVFYEAMLTSGVSELRARLMYGGVYWGGPRWSETAGHNVRLAARQPDKRVFKTRFDIEGMPIDEDSAFIQKASFSSTKFAFTESNLRQLEEKINSDNPGLRGVERFVDSMTQ